jgi:hypothetical protein
MGFSGQGSTTKALPVAVLMPGFQARCTLQVFGMVQTFINDEQKSVFPLKQVTLHGLEVGNPAVSMELDELVVAKDRCQALAFEAMLPQEQTGLMPRTERLVVYTSHYAIQGDFHMGMDTQISELIDSVRVMFLAATDAQFFPLFRSQAAIVPQAPLVYVHRRTVQMYHAV